VIPHKSHSSESWLRSDILDKEAFPPDYCPAHRNDCKGKFSMDRGGGVFILVHKNYTSSILTDIEVDPDSEMVWVQIEMAGCKRILVGSYYRPEHTDLDYIEKFGDSLRKASEKSSGHIWIGGDFNLPGINWDREMGSTLKPGDKYRPISEKFLEIVNDNFLVQVVDQPTRIQGNTANTIDLFLTNNPTLVNKVDTLPGISDHEAVFLEISVRPKLNKQPRRKVHLYNKADWEGFKSHISKFASTFNRRRHTSVQDMWSSLQNELNTAIAKFIPTKLSSPKQQHPWVPKLLKKMIRKRDYSYISKH
jgi:hypothetical protein